MDLFSPLYVKTLIPFFLCPHQRAWTYAVVISLLLQSDARELLVDDGYFWYFLDGLDRAIMFTDHDRAVLPISPATKIAEANIPPYRSKQLLPYHRTIQPRRHR
jgi:hypothetical protein